MQPKKCLLIILDGLGDRQYPELDGLTPLQAAYTPNLDCLASLGGNGLYHAGALGEPFPSEQAHFAIFGYPRAMFPGRGPLEALGAGLDLKNNEVALLAHFVSASNRQGALFVEQDQPQEVDPDQIQKLFDLVLNFEYQGVQIRLRQTKGLFGVLLLQGELSADVTDSNPMRDQAYASDVLPFAESEADVRAQATAKALRAYLRWAFDRLDHSGLNIWRRQNGVSPINALVTQRAGQMKAVPGFSARTGLTGVSIASGAMFQGLSRFIGMQAVDVSNQPDVQRDFSARLNLAVRLLSEYDFVHVHSKAPDEAAHSKNCQAKRDAVAALDRALTPHMQLLAQDPNLLTVVASDHSTPSSGPMIHSGEPVPVLMRGSTIRRDAVDVYNEISAASGVLGIIRKTELMGLVLNALNRARLLGIRDVPEKSLFWPVPAPVFRLETKKFSY